MNTQERFVRFIRHQGECHLWTGNIGSAGYPLFWMDNDQQMANRAAFKLKHGRWPHGRLRRHCTTKGCVNADHYTEYSPPPPPPDDDNKLCACGCGQRPPRASRTRLAVGHYKGHRIKYVPGHAGRSPLSDRERFDKYVRRQGECHIWTGNTSSFGRGLFWLEENTHHAHRIAWFFEYGTWPKMLWRTCQHPACVNPEHYVTKRPPR